MIRHLIKLIWNRKKQNGLMILEIFLAFLILFAVMSFAFYNIKLYNSPLGYETEDIWVVHFYLPLEVDSAEIHDAKFQIKQAMAAKSEIEEASFCNGVLPFGGSMWSTTNDDNGFEIRNEMIFADEDYDEVMGVNLIEGTWFGPVETHGKYSPIVVNKKFRDDYFPDSTMVGRLIKSDGNELIVSGVVDYFKYRGEFAEEPSLVFYYLTDESRLGLNMVLKMAPGTEPAFEAELNSDMLTLTKDWGFSISKLEQNRIRRSRSTWIPLIAMMCICGFLVFNVSLGLFGVLMYNINKRKAEIGLRRAVGASPQGIIAQFILEIIIISSLGILVGLFFAIQIPILKVFSVALSTYVYAMLVSMGIIYLLVLICTFYPSAQASLIQPATALHEE